MPVAVAGIISSMLRSYLMFLAVCWMPVACLAGDAPTIKFPSPDRRFAMRIAEPNGPDDVERKIELIEKESGNVMVDLGFAYRSHLPDTVLIWSANSKRAAYGTRDNKGGEASVYFWNGTAFEEAPLPENMPGADIHFGKGAGESVKNYGGAVKPLRWLKSGELEMSSDSMMMSRVNSWSYTGVVKFTVAFDIQHHATVHKVGKTRTTVDK